MKGSYGSTPGAVPAEDTDTLSTAELERNFRWMSAAFAINHGVSTAPLILATALLGGNLSYIGNSVFYICALVSALLLAGWLAHRVGAKSTMLVGLACYSVHIGGFAVALAIKADRWAWPLWLVCSAIGGIGGGVIWTGQGAFFAAAANALATAQGGSFQRATMGLASQFSCMYLTLEVVAKVAFSALQLAELTPAVIAGVYFLIATLSTAMLAFAHELAGPDGSSSPLSAPTLLGTLSLWSNPIIWLLAPTNLTFGFCAAFMNGKVNESFAAVELGDGWVSCLGAITALVAAVASATLVPANGNVSKFSVVTAGALCFLCIPLCVVRLGCCHAWGWRILLLYVLQGVGRAVYETTNRALFADFFPGAVAKDAFANCTLQVTGAFALSFYLQIALTQTRLATVVMVLALATPVSYAMACGMQRREERKPVATNTEHA